jgi:surface antigen
VEKEKARAAAPSGGNILWTNQGDTVPTKGYHLTLDHFWCRDRLIPNQKSNK